MSQELISIPIVNIDRSKKKTSPYDTVMSIATTVWLFLKLYSDFDVRVQGIRKKPSEKLRWLLLIQSLASLMSTESKIAARKIYYQFSHVWGQFFDCYNYLKNFAIIFDYDLLSDLNIYFESSAKIYSDLVPGLNYKLDDDYATKFKKIGEIDGPVAVIILEKNCMLRSMKNYVEYFQEQQISGQKVWTNFIIISGSGFPDSLVRRFLQFISSSGTKLKPIVITDSDPYGLHIYLTYKRYLESVKYVRIKDAFYIAAKLEYKPSNTVILENLKRRVDIDKIIVETANDMLKTKECMSLDKHRRLPLHIYELVLSEKFVTEFDNAEYFELEINPGFLKEELTQY
ncbi:uncharacterized protein KGF55_005809 [Candida pseudojiufengensis]|uniref:uncharacterized protein n=1 Tax=Candida pseudojiufengensis TaxID=497109 RepID=UPI002224E376|nr:uncharacterized protein KGF55_005809 [Candida pseudojiufengensis]KAI5958466.1 hypothetical protein KGF55_005809 [Candida pseudojiufengensis]